MSLEVILGLVAVGSFLLIGVALGMMSFIDCTKGGFKHCDHDLGLISLPDPKCAAGTKQHYVRKHECCRCKKVSFIKNSGYSEGGVFFNE